MTVEAGCVPPEPASVSSGFPVTVGWTHAALALNSALRLNTPVNITFHIEMHGPLMIDFRFHAFSWSTPLEIFRVDAVHPGIEPVPVGPDAPPYFPLPGEDLD